MHEKDASQVCHEIASRINVEPAPCGGMIAHVIQRTGIVLPIYVHCKDCFCLKLNKNNISSGI